MQTKPNKLKPCDKDPIIYQGRIQQPTRINNEEYPD